MDRRFRLRPEQAESLASKYETPLYVLDEATFISRILEYQLAFSTAYAKSKLSYASKANSTLAVLKVAHQLGLTIDVASEGELRAALLAGVPASNCHFHGNNKQLRELEFAHQQGIEMVVIDNDEEIGKIREIQKRSGLGETTYALRLAPGVDPKTHQSISTGQADTKFGFNLGSGAAEKALRRCLALGIPVLGFHCHVGSQLIDPAAQKNGGRILAEFAVRMKQELGFELQYLNVGGGLGAKYLDSDEPMPISEYCQLIVNEVVPILNEHGLDPTIAQEPGRSLIAEAGVTLYQVGSLKTVTKSDGTERIYVAVDGGLSDNPRPVMYQAKYQVERVHRTPRDWEYVTDGPGAAVSAPAQQDSLFTISGKHCETDLLFEDVQLPSDLIPGDLIQVLTTGAYNAVMSSNYNRYPRPATVWIDRHGNDYLAVRRETWEEVFSQDIDPIFARGELLG